MKNCPDRNSRKTIDLYSMGKQTGVMKSYDRHFDRVVISTPRDGKGKTLSIIVKEWEHLCSPRINQEHSPRDPYSLKKAKL